MPSIPVPSFNDACDGNPHILWSDGSTLQPVSFTLEMQHLHCPSFYQHYATATDQRVENDLDCGHNLHLACQGACDTSEMRRKEGASGVHASVDLSCVSLMGATGCLKRGVSPRT